MLDKLLDWIERRGGKREIIRDGKPYISRYYVWRSKYLTILIHKIWASDPDDVHDHPWHNASLVLRHGYYEYMGNREWPEVRLSGQWVFRKATDFHRIAVPHGQVNPTISLFFTLKRIRAWGFRTKDGWVAAKEYNRQPVDIEGRDFMIEGHLFPRVKWLVSSSRQS